MDEQVIACDVSGIARRYWQAAGVEQKIVLKIAPALETLDKLLAAGKQTLLILSSSMPMRKLRG